MSSAIHTENSVFLTLWLSTYRLLPFKHLAIRHLPIDREISSMNIGNISVSFDFDAHSWGRVSLKLEASHLGRYVVFWLFLHPCLPHTVLDYRHGTASECDSATSELIEVFHIKKQARESCVSSPSVATSDIQIEYPNHGFQTKYMVLFLFFAHICVLVKS